jgi:archaemetzincin
MDPIFLWWIGDGEADAGVMERIRAEVEHAFDRPTRLWAGAERPIGAFDPRRRQDASGWILSWILARGPGLGKVLGITDRDLFIPILTYVFGEAQLGGTVAVVSTARLRDGATGGGEGGETLEERLLKEVMHELGHAFGLHHCDTQRCVMGRSARVSEVDAKTHLLCELCHGELQARHEGGSDVQ